MRVENRGRGDIFPIERINASPSSKNDRKPRIEKLPRRRRTIDSEQPQEEKEETTKTDIAEISEASRQASEAYKESSLDEETEQ